MLQNDRSAIALAGVGAEELLELRALDEVLTGREERPAPAVSDLGTRRLEVGLLDRPQGKETGQLPGPATTGLYKLRRRE